MRTPEENRRRAMEHTKKHPLEVVYRSMMQRCGHWKGCKNATTMRRYANRGIVVCEEWRGGFRAFEKWALAHGWRRGLQIDRIDNDGNYKPSNCRFVTPKQNSNNRANRRYVERLDGSMIPFEDVAIEASKIGVPENTVRSRVRMGWKYEDIIKYRNARVNWRPNHKPNKTFRRKVK